VYSTLVERLANDIRHGHLPPGTLLPTHRQLAEQHGIAVATASRAYKALQDMGLVIGETGRGTYVRDRLLQRDWDPQDEARHNRHTADLSFNHPHDDEQAALLRDGLRQLAAGGDLAALLHQQPPGGRPHERDIVRQFLVTRGIAAHRDQVFIVNGAQQGLDIAVRALLPSGMHIAVDALTYPGIKMIADAQRLPLASVPCSNDGPDLAALGQLCRQGRIGLIYAMPGMHNPLGWVLNLAQREQLVAIARRHDCVLIEDASYAFLAGDNTPVLATLAPERTVYVSSLSKSVASGLRFGFMVVPAACSKSIKQQLRANTWSLPSLTTALACLWLQDGTVAHLEQKRREDARLRQAMARDILHGLDCQSHPNALFLWLRLPAELRMDRIATELALRNIAVSKADAYATTRHAPHALRLGLSSLPHAALADALREVREVIDTYPI
jgi:DNA-binding transcriptional MocR family regulator